MMEKKKKILACMMAMVLIVLIGFVIVDIRKQGVYDSVIKLNQGWTLIFHGDTTEVESTEKYVIPQKIDRGDSLILRRTLTKDIPDNPVLRFKTYQTYVEAFRDGSRLYSNGEENYYKGNIVGSGVHFVYFGAVAQAFQGRTLDIKFHFSENDAWNVLPSFEVLPANYAYGDFYARYSLALVVGLFLLLFGILALFLSTGMIFFGMKFFQIMIIGFLSVCLGIWTLCYTKLFQLFSFNFAFNTCIEYISLYIAPLPLYLLLLHMRYKKISKARWWGLVVVASLDVLIFIVTTILNYTHIVHYPQTLWIFHSYVVLCIIYLFISEISNKNRLDPPTKILTAGVSSFAAFAILELVRFNLMTYLHLEHTILGITWLPIGTLTFVILLVISYIVYMFRLMSTKAEKDALSVIAYKDSLTGIFNRAKCQQIFDILDKTSLDFAIISIDMNGLKHVNDRYGHNAGDQLIKAFATAFHEAFTGIGTTIRMGGDEFLAIVRKEHLEEVDATLTKMAELQKKHGKGLPIPLEAALGTAYRHELLKEETTETEEKAPPKAEDVYRLADKRMYDMKSNMKSKLVRR